MTDLFSFRQRFELAPGGRLPFGDEIAVIAEHEGAVVELRSLEAKAITESAKIAIWGYGYSDEATARAGGEHWRGATQRALAAVGVGANFGLRNPDTGGPVDSVLEQMKRETGITVYRDSWDLLVFPSEPRPRFSSMVVDGSWTPSETAVRASFAASANVVEAPNEVAFDLYTASKRSAHIADARLVLLVMAIECLLVRAERPAPSLAHIDDLVGATLQNTSLEGQDREALANALRSLRYQSTTSAARSLAAHLAASQYPDDPVLLFSEAFKLRHSLVHGHRRPNLDRVRYVGANLERMVGDLIASPAVATSVAATRT